MSEEKTTDDYGNPIGFLKSDEDQGEEGAASSALVETFTADLVKLRQQREIDDVAGEIEPIMKKFFTEDGAEFEVSTAELGSEALTHLNKITDLDNDLQTAWHALSGEEKKELNMADPIIIPEMSPDDWIKRFPKPPLWVYGTKNPKYYLTKKRIKEMTSEAVEARELQKTIWHATFTIQTRLNAIWKRTETTKKQEELQERFANIQPPIIPAYALNKQGTDGATAVSEEKGMVSKADIIDTILDTSDEERQSIDNWKTIVVERIENACKDHPGDIELIQKLTDLKTQVQAKKSTWLGKNTVSKKIIADFKADFLAGVEEKDSSDTYLSTIRRIVIKIMEGSLDFMLINGEPYSKKVYQNAYNEAFKVKESGMTSEETSILRKSSDEKVLLQWIDWCKQHVRPQLEQGADAEVVWSIMEQFPWKMKNGRHCWDMMLDTKEDCDHVEDILYRFHKAYLLPLNLRSLDIRGVWGAMRGDILATMYSRLDMMLPYIAIATSVQQIGNMSRTGNNLTNLYAGVHAKVAGRWIQISAHMLIAALSPDEVSDYNTMNVALTWFARFSDQSAWGSPGGILDTKNILEIPQDHVNLLVSRLPVSGDQRGRAQKKFNEQRDAWAKAVNAYTVSANTIANTVARVLGKLKRERD